MSSQLKIQSGCQPECRLRKLGVSERVVLCADFRASLLYTSLPRVSCVEHVVVLEGSWAWFEQNSRQSG